MKICSDFVTIRFYFIFYIFFFVNWLAIKSCFRNIADISPYFMFFPKNSSFLVKKDMDLLKHGTQQLNYLTVFVADEILNLFLSQSNWSDIVILPISTLFMLSGLLEEWTFGMGIWNIYIICADWPFGRMKLLFFNFNIIEFKGPFAHLIFIFS